MELWIIKRVTPTNTKHPAVTRWDVQAARVCDPFRVRFMSTINMLHAALCDRAAEKHLTVAMRVEDQGYGLHIISVELAGEAKPEIVVKRNGVIGNAEMFERR